MWQQVSNKPLPKQVKVDADQHWEKSSAELVREILANPPPASTSEYPLAKRNPADVPQPSALEQEPQREAAYTAQPAASSRVPSLAEGELMHLQPVGLLGQRAFRDEPIAPVHQPRVHPPRLAEYVASRQPESQLTLAAVRAIPQPPVELPPQREEIPTSYVPNLPTYQPPPVQPAVPSPTNIKPEQPVKFLGVVENARGESVAMLEVSGQGTVLTRAGERVMIEQPGRMVVLRVEAVERGVVYLRDEQLNKVLILR